MRRIPLAWCNLVHDKRRFLVSILGIGFAILLMFVELGFWNALLDSSTLMIDQFNADLVVVSKSRYALMVAEKFTTHRLEQVKRVPGVLAAFPVYIETENAQWRDTESGQQQFLLGNPNTRAIQLVAWNPDFQAFKLPEIADQTRLLRVPYNLLIDRHSKSMFGKREPGLSREVAGHNVTIAGAFSLGTSFSGDGLILSSDQTFYDLLGDRLSPGAPLGMADVGLIQLRAGYSLNKMRDELTTLLPDDVKVMTLEEFSNLERLFWQTTTPIGVIFLFGLVMGFIVGAVICFQILSADVADHLKEYATLKAIGYQDSYLNRVVLTQALWLCSIAFLPAVAMTLLLYRLLSQTTGLPMHLNVTRGLIIFGLATIMCGCSGFMALQKIKSADPAEVF